MQLFHLLEGGHERGGALSTDVGTWCMGTITGRVRCVSVALSSGAKDGVETILRVLVSLLAQVTVRVRVRVAC